jgi:hypothetical protein
MPEKITLSTQLVNAVLAYLGSQPYQNVAQLIQGIQSEAQGQVVAAQAEEPAAE